jgi:DNA adenine methylase
MKQFPLKCCLRYPGGKSKALKTLSSWIPTDFKEYREPFVGGGSLALLISQNYPKVPIWINDKYFYLYNFWVQLRDNGQQLSQRLIGDLELFDKAVAFYVMNKCSYSGLTENSKFSIQASKSNFTLKSIDKLPLFSNIIQNWKITNLDYESVMNEKGEDVFVFLDPPYNIKDFLYGTKAKLHSSFSHNQFADDVDKCSHRFMLTYNQNDWIIERYKNYNIHEWKLRYFMHHRGEKGTQDNVKTELLITNYSLSAPALDTP